MATVEWRGDGLLGSGQAEGEGGHEEVFRSIEVRNGYSKDRLVYEDRQGHRRHKWDTK